MSGLTAGVIPKLFAKLTTSADGAITLQATAVKPIKVKITGGAGYKVQRGSLYKVQWSKISRFFTERVPL